MTRRFYRAAAAKAVWLVVLTAGCSPSAAPTAPAAPAAPTAPAAPASTSADPSAPAGARHTERVSQTQRLMGVPWTITLYAESPAAGRAAIAAGFAEVARLERILSDYDLQSELSRLSAAAPTTAPEPVSDDLWRVLVRAVEVRDATDGAFDPTVGPLTSLWRQARRSGRLPLPGKLAAARESVGRDTLRLVSASREVVLTRPAMRLDLGGIGMGYAVDRAVELLNRHGITAAMVDASGDIAVTAPPPGTAGWKIAVAPLAARGEGAAARDTEYLLLTHAAVTTSGDAFQAVEIDGRRYSHIVDPRTGLGVAGPAAVTVVAADCTTADALATAASVLGPEKAAAVIAATPDCAARFVSIVDGRPQHSQTPRWPSQPSQSPR